MGPLLPRGGSSRRGPFQRRHVLVVIALWASVIGRAIDLALLAVVLAIRRGPAPGWQAAR